MLAVVEDEQHGALAHHLEQNRDRGARALLHTDRREHRLRKERGVLERRELHPDHTMRIRRRRAARDLRGETRLAAAARSRERQQARVVQQPQDRGYGVVTSDEGGERSRSGGAHSLTRGGVGGSDNLPLMQPSSPNFAETRLP